MSFLDYFIQSDFPCPCGGPSPLLRERVETHLTQMLVDNPTPLPMSFDPTRPDEDGVPGSEPLFSYGSYCPCQVDWSSLTRQLILAMAYRNTVTGPEFSQTNELIRSLLDIFTGKRYETYYKTSIHEIIDAFS